MALLGAGSSRPWWTNHYGAITDGQFEIFKQPPSHLRKNKIHAFTPWCLYDMRSGRAAFVRAFSTADRAKGGAKPSMPIVHPEAM